MKQSRVQLGFQAAGWKTFGLARRFQCFPRLVLKSFKCIPLFSDVGNSNMLRKYFISDLKAEFLMF